MDSGSRGREEAGGEARFALVVPFQDRTGQTRNLQVAAVDGDVAITIPTGVAQMRPHQVGLLDEALERTTEASK